jgi:hypothetical protein
MNILYEDWFSDKNISHSFQQFFDNVSEKILEDLKINGKTYYLVRHYDKEKSSKKKDCRITKESDFMNISIELKEYGQLIKELFIDYEYHPKKITKRFILK